MSSKSICHIVLNFYYVFAIHPAITLIGLFREVTEGKFIVLVWFVFMS